MSSSTEGRSLWADKADHYIVAVLAVMVLGVMAPLLGVWEPWEADAASVAQNMLSSGQWLQVVVGADGSGQAISELPFGFWPIASSVAILGVNELGLRLPGLLLAIAVLLLVFNTTRQVSDRWTAWLAVIILLILPIFGFHSRFALGHATTMMMVTIACLSFCQLRLNPERAYWSWIAWTTTAFAGLSGGVPAVVVPILTAIALALTDRREDTSDAGTIPNFFGVPTVLMIALVGLGWWRASIYRPDHAPLETLLLWANTLGRREGRG